MTTELPIVCIETFQHQLLEKRVKLLEIQVSIFPRHNADLKLSESVVAETDVCTAGFDGSELASEVNMSLRRTRFFWLGFESCTLP